MDWHPIGPDFVFAPRNPNFKRLSRRNEWGKQCLISDIAVDPTDPRTLYVVMRPWTGGTTAFRTRNGGATWTALTDTLQQSDFNIDPSCMAVNPAYPETVYLATWGNRKIYISNRRGEAGSWDAGRLVGGPVRKLIVDVRRAATLGVGATELYAATQTGVFHSPDNGRNWNRILNFDTISLVAHLPATGTPVFYAGLWQRGVQYSTDPTRSWTDLSTGGLMLPAFTMNPPREPAGNFHWVAVDYCPRRPQRAYAWLLKWGCDAAGTMCGDTNAGLYTTDSPTTRWTRVNLPSDTDPTRGPKPYQGLYNAVFAVAPNSPGDGARDILFFGEWPLYRSIDGGRTWTHDVAAFYNDKHAMAFFPPVPGPGEIPALYLGCDGGIGRSTRAADPDASFRFYPPERNEDFDEDFFVRDAGIRDSGRWENYNHGLQSLAAVQYAADPTIGAIGYAACGDTGVTGSSGALGWRYMGALDAAQIGAAQAADGVKVWVNTGSPYSNKHFTDRREITPPGAPGVALGLGGPGVASTCNHEVAIDGSCLAGVNVIGRTTQCVVRMGQDGIATQISQDFAPESVSWLARHPIDANIVYCATTAQVNPRDPRDWRARRVWRTASAASASSSTVWTEVTGLRPDRISSLTIERSGSVYVLLTMPLAADGSALPSPLCEISTGSWNVQNCSGQPSGGAFGRILADPVQSDTLYATHDAQVYRLTRNGPTWMWQRVGNGLPGSMISDLWVGNIAPPGSPPKVLLRATISSRGVWECDVTAGAPDPPVSLYLRDNLLDLGWLDRSPANVPNPYDPSNPGARLYHYQCEDIKLDAVQRGSAGVGDFFQTDPQADPALSPALDPDTTPRQMTHVLFDLLRDNSQNLPSSERAWVHVQVHNRSNNPANNVSVWAIACSAAAGVPSLNAGRARGDSFWSQFRDDGTIIPSLPSETDGGRWASLGDPKALSGITASRPRIASWLWSIPRLTSGDRGHYCIVTFVHSARSRVGEMSETSVDALVARNRQVGQKNLHIVNLPPSGGAMSGPMSEGMVIEGEDDAPGRSEYIEFHNPTGSLREASLVLDLRGLPGEIKVSFQLTRLETAVPLAEAMIGIQETFLSPSETPLPESPDWLVPSATAGLASLLYDIGASLLDRRRGLPPARTGFWWHLLRASAVSVITASFLRRRPRRPLPVNQFEPAIYVARPSARVELSRIQLRPFDFGALRLWIEQTGELEPGTEYAFQVQQVVKQEVVGGSVYVVRVAGERSRPAIKSPPERWEEDKKEEDELLSLPPWLREPITARRREMGKEGSQAMSEPTES